MGAVTPVLLAIDAQTPGIGWAVLRMRDGVAIDWGWTPIPEDGWLEDRVRGTIEATRPELHGWEVAMVVVERPRGGVNVQSLMTVAEVGGQVAQACRWRWPDVPVNRPTASDWKRAAGLKGNAPKAAVMAAAQPLLRGRALDFGKRSQDVADALVMGFGEWCLCDEAARRGAA